METTMPWEDLFSSFIKKISNVPSSKCDETNCRCGETCDWWDDLEEEVECQEICPECEGYSEGGKICSDRCFRASMR